MNESNGDVLEGIPVEPEGRQIDCSPFKDCVQALAAGDRLRLNGSVAVLTYRIILGDIFKKSDT